MATNLRLRPEAEAALRAEAERSGALLVPRSRYRKVTPTQALPAGVTSLDLLDRDTYDQRLAAACAEAGLAVAAPGAESVLR